MSLNEKGVAPPPSVEEKVMFIRWLNDLRQGFPRVNSYQPTLNPTSVAANNTSEQTFTVAGLSTSDIIYINKTSHTAGIGIGNVRVSAKDTIAITFCNLTGGAIDPPSETYNIIAIRR